MAKFIPDVKTTRWIIISSQRQARPADYVPVPATGQTLCAFCEGNEHLTPPEIFRRGSGDANKPTWKIRVVPNKFPITDIHEVIIHSPDHNKDIAELDIVFVKLILQVYKSRYEAHMENGHVMIFCNHGAQAGASLKHPHSQLVVIPRQINLDALAKEPVTNIIDDGVDFVTYCPDFSQWPYEVWIAPKREGTRFSDITENEIVELAPLLQNSLKRLNVIYSRPENSKISAQFPFSYNYYIHHEKNWFIRIIPRFVHRAGFELGTGLNVNITDPTVASLELKSIKV